MAKKDKNQATGIENIEGALSRTELFIENNYKTLLIILVVIAAIVLGYLYYTRMYLPEKQVKATTEMYMAEQYFAKDSFNLALNGDGNYEGFLYIIDEYSGTKSGNLAVYYTGICYLNMGQYEDAITYLEDFASEDKVLSAVAKGATGDAYMELGDQAKAVALYIEAATKNVNDFSSPVYRMKAARTYEIMGNYAEAVKQYEIIEKDFKETIEGKSVAKYLHQAKIKAGLE